MPCLNAARRLRSLASDPSDSHPTRRMSWQAVRGEPVRDEQADATASRTLRRVITDHLVGRRICAIVRPHAN